MAEFKMVGTKIDSKYKNINDFEGAPAHCHPYTEIYKGNPSQPRNTAEDGFLNSLSVYFGYF